MKIKHIAILLSPIALLIGCLSESGPAAQDEKTDTLSSSIFASSSSELSISSSEGSVTRKSSAKTRSSSSSQQDNYSEESLSSSSTSDGTLKKCYVEYTEEEGSFCVWSTDMSESDCTGEGGQLVTSCKTTGVVDKCSHSSDQGSMTYVAYDETAAGFCTYVREIDSLSSLVTSSSSISSSSSNYIQEQAIGCYLEDSDIGPLCVWTNTATQDDCTESQGTVKSACPAGSTQSCDYSQDDIIYKFYSYSEDISDLCSLSLAKRLKKRLLP